MLTEETYTEAKLTFCVLQEANRHQEVEASSRYAGVAQNRAWSPAVRAAASADRALSGSGGEAGL